MRGMKTIIKKIFRTPFVTTTLSRLTAAYIRFVFKTCRWEFQGRENIQPYWEKQSPLITCFWHGRLFMMPHAWQSINPFSMLISAHPDGRFIAQAIQHHGLGTVTGSSSKGGTAALRGLLSLLKEGGSVGITPDGPRGPRYKASDGIVMLSRLSGVDILPATYAVSKNFIVQSWDRFRIPLPFCKAIMIWGQSIPAPSKKASGQELEKTRQHVENQLNMLCDQADGFCGIAQSCEGKIIRRK